MALSAAATPSPPRYTEVLQTLLALRGKPLAHVLTTLAEMPVRAALSLGFGREGMVVADAIWRNNLSIDVFTLDTGRQFEETFAFQARVEARYKTRVAVITPEAADLTQLFADQGPLGFYESLENRQTCCFVRKVKPLQRALKDYDVWLTGLRATQSAYRAEQPYAEYVSRHDVVKLNPILDWPREDVLAYLETHNVPEHPLYAQGYTSIGCAPCTRAVLPDEPERAGRWWWETDVKKECGLHLDHAEQTAEPTAEPVTTATP